MTFYIPPVFLFANKVKHNNKPINKPKTATQTAIEIENSNIKRIAELEEENRKLKSERDKWRWKYNRLKSEFNLLQDRTKSLREENKRLSDFLECEA